MNVPEFYKAIQPNMRNFFGKGKSVVLYNSDIDMIAENLVKKFPNAGKVYRNPLSEIFPGKGRTLDNLLYFLTVQKQLQVFAHILERNKKGEVVSIMVPWDYEVAFREQHRKEEHYKRKRDMIHNLNNYVIPITLFLDEIFTELELAHYHELTPSGGHVLVKVKRYDDNGKVTKAWEELKNIGYVDPVVMKEYEKAESEEGVIVDEDAALVYSGIGFLTHFIGELIMQNVELDEGREKNFSNPGLKQLSWDGTFSGYLCMHRCIREGIHLKRAQVLHHPKFSNIRYNPPALALVPIKFYDPEGPGKNVGMIDLNKAMDAFWDFRLAAEIFNEFTGHVPYANQGFVNLKEAYVESELRTFHKKELIDSEEHDFEDVQDEILGSNPNHKTRLVIEEPWRVEDPNTGKKFLLNLEKKGLNLKKRVNTLHGLFNQIGEFESSPRLRAEYWATRFGFREKLFK